MPPYNFTPIPPRAILVPTASRTFLLGHTQVTGGYMYVTSVALATNVATVDVAAFEGNLPVVGTLITITGTSQAAGAFNVTNAVVTAVSFNAAGVGTVTFALTGANLATTIDGGTLTFFPAIIGETIVAGSSMAGTPSSCEGRTNSYAVEVYFPTIPTAATVSFQGALANDDASFIDITSPIATVAGGAVTAMANPFIQTNFPFVRFHISGLTGTGTIAAVLTL